MMLYISRPRHDDERIGRGMLNEGILTGWGRDGYGEVHSKH